jgi:uncharacterized BrkB/YihY/UPF0761 family membrane protein
MKIIALLIAVATAVFFAALTVSASDIASSKLATGTEKLIKDMTSWLLVIAPTVGGLTVIYFFIRRTIGDEMDHKKWNGRIVGALICTVLAMLASPIINLLMDYFK